MKVYRKSIFHEFQKLIIENQIIKYCIKAKKESIADDLESYFSKYIYHKINYMEIQSYINQESIGNICMMSKKILCLDSKKYLGFCKQPCLALLDSIINEEEVFYCLYNAIQKEYNDNNIKIDYLIEELVFLIFCDLIKPHANYDKLIRNMSFIIKVN